MKNTKLVLVTTKELEELDAEFSDWFDTQSHMGEIFYDVRGICRGIVMEYLANKQGKTIYTYIAAEVNNENH